MLVEIILLALPLIWRTAIRIDFIYVSPMINACEMIVSSLAYLSIFYLILKRSQNVLKALFIIKILYILLSCYIP
jgi:hypothetical protein